MASASLKPLNEDERQRVAGVVATVKRDMPELVPLIKDLHELGMFDGWRVIVLGAPDRPDPPGCIHTGQMVLESATALKERMKHEAATR